jgi:hypothetical protein
MFEVWGGRLELAIGVKGEARAGPGLHDQRNSRVTKPFL